jgi:uncharacterized membrane protein YqaE (UPF0057 family)
MYETHRDLISRYANNIIITETILSMILIPCCLAISVVGILENDFYNAMFCACLLCILGYVIGVIFAFCYIDEMHAKWENDKNTVESFEIWVKSKCTR